MAKINIDITPTEYKKLWWDAVCTCMPSIFTMKELHEMLLKRGVDYNINNLSRDALKNAPIEVLPGVSLRTRNGRPPLLYRVVRSTREST